MYVCMHACMYVCMYVCMLPSISRKNTFSCVFAMRTSKNTEFSRFSATGGRKPKPAKKTGRGNRAWDPSFATPAPRRLRVEFDMLMLVDAKLLTPLARAANITDLLSQKNSLEFSHWKSSSKFWGEWARNTGYGTRDTGYGTRGGTQWTTGPRRVK